MSRAFQLECRPGRLRECSWKEYALRFVFGGAVTAIAGVLGHVFGPVVGGLFLGFPAILPATVTLVQRHEDHDAASAEAAGASLGAVGLAAFGLVVWQLAPRVEPALMLLIAALVWLAVSTLLWTALRLSRGSRRLSAARPRL